MLLYKGTGNRHHLSLYKRPCFFSDYRILLASVCTKIYILCQIFLKHSYDLLYRFKFVIWENSNFSRIVVNMWFHFSFHLIFSQALFPFAFLSILLPYATFAYISISISSASENFQINFLFLNLTTSKLSCFYKRLLHFFKNLLANWVQWLSSCGNILR